MDSLLSVLTLRVLKQLIIWTRALKLASSMFKSVSAKDKKDGLWLARNAQNGIKRRGWFMASSRKNSVWGQRKKG